MPRIIPSHINKHENKSQYTIESSSLSGCGNRGRSCSVRVSATAAANQAGVCTGARRHQEISGCNSQTTSNCMKVAPVTTTKTRILPVAAVLTGSAALIGCEQQQPQPTGGAPLPPPEMVMPTDAAAQQIKGAQAVPSGSRSQQIPGRQIAR